MGHPLEGTLSRDNIPPLQKSDGSFAEPTHTNPDRFFSCHPFSPLRPLFLMRCFHRLVPILHQSPIGIKVLHENRTPVFIEDPENRRFPAVSSQRQICGC